MRSHPGKPYVILSDPERSRGGVEGSVSPNLEKTDSSASHLRCSAQNDIFLPGCIDSQKASPGGKAGICEKRAND